MFIAKGYPTNYIQNQGILSDTASWVQKFGTKPFLLAGPTAWSIAGPAIEQSLQENRLDFQLEMFQGHCSDQELDRVLSKVDPSHDIIIGVGGGQCLDMAKLVANRLRLPVMTVSTLASTCAASSALSIIYTPEHVFVRMEEFDQCPVAVLVDPDIIAHAPARYLSAGIGDTLVKWYEAYPINQGRAQNAKTKAGLKIAELVKELLLEYGETAILECNQNETGEALSQVIDANILLGGIVGGLGRDTCAASGAHAIHYGMTIIPEMQEAFHGELVAYGLLCQLKLEEKSDEEIIQLMHYYQKINLPISLFDLGLQDIREEDLRQAASKACAPEQTIHQLPFPIIEEKVYESFLYIHDLGEKVKKGS